LATRKLLLADDSVTIQKVVNLTFADEGMEVTSVGDGSSAIEKLDELMPDIVLADIHMPGLTGYQVCGQIKQNPKFQHIPVILLVGSFEPFDEEEAKRSGADDYLTKPFQSIRQLVSRVNALIPQQAPELDEGYSERQFAETISLDRQTLYAEDQNIPQTGPIDSSYGVEQPTPEYWGERAQTQTFEDSEIEDELLEATPISGTDISTEATVLSTSPRETTRLSAEEIKAFNLYDTTSTIPLQATEEIQPQAEEPAEEVRTPAEEQVEETVTASVEEQIEGTTQAEEEVEETVAPSAEEIFEPVPTAEQEEMIVMSAEEPSAQPDSSPVFEPAVAAVATHSPYSTTPLSEDMLLDLGYGEDVATVTEVYDADDFVLELDDEEEVLEAKSTVVKTPVVFSETRVDTAELEIPESVVEVEGPTEQIEEVAYGVAEVPVEFDASTQVEEVQEQPFEVIEPPVAEEIALGEADTQDLAPPETGFEEIAPAEVITEEVSAPEAIPEELQAVAQETTPAPFESAEVQTVGSAETQTTTAVVAPVIVGAESLSPEAIEAIARRVVEMMSDKAVQEIAWEVVPELADLHIKRKLQEKNL